MSQPQFQSLPQLLESSYNYSQPLYYFLSANPFSDFMPFDQALQDQLNKTGRQLYADYIKDSTNYWNRKITTPLIVKSNEPRTRMTRFGSLHSQGNNLFVYLRDQNKLREYALIFDPTSGWLKSMKPQQYSIDASLHMNVFSKPKNNLMFGFRQNKDPRTGFTSNTLVKIANNTVTELTAPRPAEIGKIIETNDKIVWTEYQQETSKLCWITKAIKAQGFIGKPTCPLKETLPRKLSIIGEKSHHQQTNLQLKI